MLPNSVESPHQSLDCVYGLAETVNSYSTSAIHAYTDGSAFKATINAGFGILLTLMGLLLSTVTAVEPTAQIMKQKRLLSKQPYN